jgi:FAD dependent oxidoreductase TIGR03364
MHFDVICVGAGALGTFHAYFAAKKGKKVLLVERDFTPYEGTVRNFGQCVASGQEIPLWRERGIKALKTYKAIQAKTDITLRNNGTCYIASDDAEMRLLEEMHQYNMETDYESKLLGKEDVIYKYPALKPDYVKGALFYRQEISLEPRTAITKIIDFVQKDGGVLFKNNTTVIRCEKHAGKIEILTADGSRYTADHVIICSGQEFKILFPEQFRSSGMRVSKLQMMQTEPMPQLHLPGNILTGYSIRRYEAFHSMPSYKTCCANFKDEEIESKYGIHILFKQAADGSIIIGDSHEYASAGNTESLDFGVDTYINNLMLREAKKVIDLPNWNIGSVWNGYYATHQDGIYDREVEEGIHIVTGIGGKGMSTGAGYAEEKINGMFI